jgi:predicted dehydrogenase
MSVEYVIVGIGSIGERHTKNLITLGVPPTNIGLCDVNQSLLKKKSKLLGIDNYSHNLKKLLKKKPKAVFICAPNEYHIEQANMVIDSDIDVFIEKPISNTSKRVTSFLEKARTKNRIVMVGYCLRFDDILIKVKNLIETDTIGKVYSMKAQFGQYLPDWQPREDYRKICSGIILDASHEIDYAKWLLGDIVEIKAFGSKLSNLEIKMDDVVEVLLKHKNNELTNLHLDYLYRGYLRNGNVIGSKGCIEWDLGWNKIVRLLRYDDVTEWKFEKDFNKKYITEIKHFLDCVLTHKQPTVNGEEGLTVLKLCEKIEKNKEGS